MILSWLSSLYPPRHLSYEISTLTQAGNPLSPSSHATSSSPSLSPLLLRPARAVGRRTAQSCGSRQWRSSSDRRQIGASRERTRRPSRAEQSEAGAAAGRRSGLDPDAAVVHGIVAVLLGKSSAGRRDGWLRPALASLSVRPTKKRGPRAGAAPPVTGDRYLDLLVRFVASQAGELLDGSFILRLHPVGLHYIASRLEALRELEAVGAGAPVDYLRAYVVDLGDHRALEQLRRILRLLTSLKVVTAGPGRDPAPLSLSCRSRAFGCSSSGAATSPPPPPGGCSTSATRSRVLVLILTCM